MKRRRFIKLGLGGGLTLAGLGKSVLLSKPALAIPAPNVATDGIDPLVTNPGQTSLISPPTIIGRPRSLGVKPLITRPTQLPLVNQSTIRMVSSAPAAVQSNLVSDYLFEVYSSSTSVMQGGQISFRARLPNGPDTVSSYVSTIEFYRIGGNAATPGTQVYYWLKTATARVRRQPVPANAPESGCGWPSVYTLTVPASWPSGVYMAWFYDFSSPHAPQNGCHFVVKANQSGATSTILLNLPCNTAQAYNQYGGRSLYYDTDLVVANRARKVSFLRPTPWPYERELNYIVWLENNGIPYECCTDVDLHASPSLLSNYRLFLGVGHYEYWSKQMRDSVEAFIGNGNNVAFFGANTCWWQVRFENSNKTLVCYKAEQEDPLYGKQNSLVTVNWYNPLINRPENTMTGVSYRNGAGIFYSCNSSQAVKFYTIYHPEHWVFNGLPAGLGTFGEGQEIIGYETDAAQFTMVAGMPTVTGQDGTPLNFEILAVADLTDWDACGQAGWATMGIYQRNGTVFNAGTVDWQNGLSAGSPVHQITLNVINALK